MSNVMDYVFDASQFQPDQGAVAIPAGRYVVGISNTELRPTKDGKSMQFVVEYQVIEGPNAGARLYDRFNLFHENTTTSRISHQQLAAICYSVGIQHVKMQDQGAALRGAKLQVDVTIRNSPEYGMQNDVKKRYDIMGNDPGHAGQRPMTSPGPQPGSAPVAGNGPAAAAGSWGTQPAPTPAAAPQPAPTPPAGAWSPAPQGAPAPGAPAWGGGIAGSPTTPAAQTPAPAGQQWTQQPPNAGPAWGNR